MLRITSARIHPICVRMCVYIFIGKAVFKRHLLPTISFLPCVLNLTLKTHESFLRCVQLQPHGAVARLPHTCTIQMDSSMPVPRARLHLVWLLPKASAAELLHLVIALQSQVASSVASSPCDCTAITSTHCTPMFFVLVLIVSLIATEKGSS